MKRKVRIYKDPNGQGGYVNKTAQWLSRADDGMQTGINNIQIVVPTSIAPGIYFSHVKYNDLVITQRVVINK